MLSTQLVTTLQLTDPQRNFIKSVISHFFMDLPTDKTAFLEKAQEIKNAFCNELKTGEFIDLQNCIFNPKEYLSKLDMLNTNVSIGQVQHYILNVTKRILITAAKKAGVTYEELGWDGKKILTFLSKREEFQTQFKSAKIRTHGDDSYWDLQFPPGTMYHAEFKQSVPTSEEELKRNPFVPYRPYLNLQVTVPFTPDKKQSKIIKFKPIPQFSRDDKLAAKEEESFIRQVTPAALEMAESAAADMIIADLKLADKKPSSGAKILLTYEFYYHLVSEKKMDFNKIRELKLSRARILAHPNIIHLIKNNILSFEMALTLTSKQKNVITSLFHFDKILKSEYRLTDFISLTDDQCDTLTLPNIQQLLKKNIITTFTDRCITHAIGTVLSDEFYFNLISTTPELLTQLHHLTTEQSQTLLSPQIINLISRHILTLTQAINLPASHKTILLLPTINQLLQDNKITLEQSLRLTETQALFLQNNPQIYQLIHMEEISPEEIDSLSFHFFVKIFKIRLTLFFNNRTLQVNGVIDDVNKIIFDIQNFTVIKPYTHTSFVYTILQQFLKTIKFELENTYKLDDVELPDIYKNIHRLIVSTQREALEEKDKSIALEKWGKAFSAITTIAHNTLESLRLDSFSKSSKDKRTKITSTLFTEEYNKYSTVGVKTFCKRILKLAPFNAEKITSIKTVRAPTSSTPLISDSRKRKILS